MSGTRDDRHHRPPGGLTPGTAKPRNRQRPPGGRAPGTTSSTRKKGNAVTAEQALLILTLAALIGFPLGCLYHKRRHP